MKNTNILYTEGWVSIIINILPFGLKYFVGISSHSVAIIADAWHSLSDSLTSVILIIGAKVSKKPPDKEHPFGHERAELIASIIIGVLLFLVVYEFLQKSIVKLLSHKTASYNSITFFVIITSILIKEGLAQYAFFLYRKTGSSVLKADGWHHRSDAISSVVVLLGILLGKYIWWIDSFLGIAISMLIGYTAFEIIRDSVSPLLGEAPDETLIEKVRELSNMYQEIGNLHAHHFHIHNYGTHKELTFHLVFPEDMPIKKCHEIATCIEEKIKKELGIEATIHLESR